MGVPSASTDGEASMGAPPASTDLGKGFGVLSGATSHQGKSAESQILFLADCPAAAVLLHCAGGGGAHPVAVRLKMAQRLSPYILAVCPV